MLANQVKFFRVLGIKVHLTDVTEVLDVIDQWVCQRHKCNYIIATGMHGAIEAHKRPYFRTIVESAGLFVPDGFSLVALAKMRGFKIDRRLTGYDLMVQTCKQAEKLGHRVFFYGDTIDTLNAMSDQIGKQFPNLKIAGFHSPPFRILTEEEDEEELNIINRSRPDILWVGLGLPKQEQWIYEHRERLNVPVAVGVGAAFKFLSGKVKRAPSWIGDNGFEWLWRLLLEPKRVWRRVFLDGPHFIGCVLLETLDGNRYRNTK